MAVGLGMFVGFVLGGLFFFYIVYNVTEAEQAYRERRAFVPFGQWVRFWRSSDGCT
jgi:hypothetical protein